MLSVARPELARHLDREKFDLGMLTGKWVRLNSSRHRLVFSFWIRPTTHRIIPVWDLAVFALSELDFAAPEMKKKKKAPFQWKMRRERERKIPHFKKRYRVFMDRELYYGMKERPPNCKIVVESLLQVDSHE